MSTGEEPDTGVSVQNGHGEIIAISAQAQRILGLSVDQPLGQTSERVHRMIAEFGSDMVAWQLVSDSTFLWVSPASRAVLGFTPDELVGKTSYGLVHPDDRAALDRWRQALADGQTDGLTLRMRHADGSYRWVESTARVLPPQDGAPLQMVTSQRDVTDRVVAEQARDAALRLLEAAAEHATVGVALSSVTGATCYANPALCTMLGRSANELIGHDLGEFTPSPETGPERGLRAVKAGNSTNHETEVQFRRADGTTAWGIRTVIALPAVSAEGPHLMVQLQDITARKEAVAELEMVALTDPVTGLLNRTVLEDRLTCALASAQRDGTPVGVLFIDLNHFKQINDTFGHDVGDTVLRKVGIRLARTVRPTDTVVRLGGDEFVVVCEHLTGAVELDKVADRIRKAISKPFLINGQSVITAASVGATTGVTVTAGELLRRADEAMYEDKRRRRREPVPRYSAAAGA